VDAGIVTVQMPGGEAEVEVREDFAVLLRAPAQIILKGEIPGEVVGSWI
jgi:hypothetical protein